MGEADDQPDTAPDIEPEPEPEGDGAPPDPDQSPESDPAQAGEAPEAEEDSDELREQIRGEFEQAAALERFQMEQPTLWLQAQRVGQVMEYQLRCEDRIFKSGACFLHANLPDHHSFAIKQIMEIDLEACLVTAEIYGDGELLDGIVLLPLESISWFGFPENAIPVNFTFQGFTKIAAQFEEK